jgi:hypothetical protein
VVSVGPRRQNDLVPASDAENDRAENSVAYDFEGALYEWEGPAAWHFITVPVGISDEIAARTEGFTNGFGSVRVRARIGGSAWQTSLFPDAKQQAYVLPVKKAVRQAEALDAGAIARVHLELADLRP